MTDSLFKIYKKFYQRAYRHPDNLELKTITDTIYDVIKDLYNSSHNPEEHKIVKTKAKII
jgi:hypothetical protein